MARRRQFKRIEGQVLAENTTMLEMCRALGFQHYRDPDEPEIMQAKLELADLEGAMRLQLWKPRT
jgi:acetyltransferase